MLFRYTAGGGYLCSGASAHGDRNHGYCGYDPVTTRKKGVSHRFRLDYLVCAGFFADFRLSLSASGTQDYFFADAYEIL